MAVGGSPGRPLAGELRGAAPRLRIETAMRSSRVTKADEIITVVHIKKFKKHFSSRGPIQQFLWEPEQPMG